MVHHIVMWKFKPEIEEAKKPELKKAMNENLSALVGKVPGLLTVEFVEEPIPSSTHDIALVTTLEKAEDIAVLRNTSGSCGRCGYLCETVRDRTCVSGL